MSDIGKRVSIDVSVNTNNAEKSIDELTKKLTRLTSRKFDVRININKSQCTKQINEINNSVKKLTKNVSKIKVGIDTKKTQADINNFTANLTGAFGKIEKESNKSGKNIAKNMSNSLKNVDGTKAATNFVKTFTKTMSSRTKLIQKSLESVMKMASSAGPQAAAIAAGVAIAAAIAIGIAKGASKIHKSINDAINHDYGEDLKAKGMQGSLIDKQIDAKGMGKELTAVTKKYVNAYLDFKNSVSNTGKAISQAAKYVAKGGDKNNVKLGISNKKLRELVKTGDEYLSKWKSIYSKIKDTEKPFRTLANMGFNKASDELTKSLIRSIGEFKKLKKTSDKVFAGMKVGAKAAALGIVKGMQGVLNAIPIVGKFLGGFFKLATSFIRVGIRFATNIIKGITGLIKGFINVGKKIVSFISKGITGVVKLGVKIVKGIFNGIKSALMFPINAGKLIINAIKKGINMVLTPIKFGVNIAKGIIRGITSVVSGFIKVGKTIGTAIIKGITGTLKFVGAFAKTFVNLGLNISKAIGRGIKSGLGFVTNSIKALTKGIMAPIKLMGRTISSTIGTAFSISKSVMGGIGNTIMEALNGDHTIELELVPSTGNIFTSLIDKRDVTNQLKRDLSVITQTMPKELGQVTNAFGAKILDAGAKVQRYANLMLQAYDFVRSNKGVIVSTFQKLYGTMAPVAKRIMSDLGIVLRDYGQKAMGALRAKMLEKVSPVIEPFKTVLSVIKDEFLNIRESLSGFSGQLRDVVGVFKSRIRDIIDNLVILAADIQGRFTQIVDSFIGVADAARVSFKDILGNLGGVVEVIKSKMGDSASVISLAVEFFKNKFHEVANGIEGKFDGVINVIKTNLPKIMQALTNLMGVVVQNVKVALDKVIDAFNKLKPVVVSAADKVKEFVANISVDDIKKKFNELKTSLTKLIGKIKTFMEVMMYVASFLVGWFYPVTAPIIALVGAAYLLVKAFHFMHGVMSKFSGFMSSGFRNIFNKVKDYWDKKTGNYDYDSRKRDIENNSKYELRSTKERVGQYLIKGDLGLNRGNEEANKLLERHNKLRFQYIDQEKKIRELASKGRNTAGAYEKLKDLDLKLFETDNELMRYFRASTRDIFGFTKDMGTEEANDEMDGLKKSIEEAEKAAKDFEQTKKQSFDFAGVKKSFDDLVKQMQDSSDEFKESFTGGSNQNKGNNRGKDFPKDNPNKYKDEAKKFARQSEDALKDFKKSLEDIFKSEPMQNIKNDVKETFNGEEVQQFKQTLAEAFDSSSIDNVKEAIGKAFDKETTDKIKQTVTGSFDNEFTQALKERIVKAAEEAKKAATTVASEEQVEKSKSNLKDVGSTIRKKVEVTAETRLLQQKLDGTFQSMRHPVNALKEYISAKLGKVHINLTVKGEQQAKKAVNDVYNALQRFKSAKGSEKLTAGIDVAIQSIKYKLITLKNTMKENFVSNLINKMSGKAKKASKELAENVPGGAKTIGFFKSSLGKLSLLLGGFGIGSYIKQATDLALKYEASAMQIQNSLGAASQKIMDFAQNSAAALGISQTQAVEYGNKFSLMVRQFEKDTDKIANTSNALMQAAAITASATGTELSTVMDSFQSALTGSSESVDQYSLNLKIANMEQRLGIDNWNDLTVAQQQYYITQELINQTTANFGNKTLKNTNSMLAQFKAQLSNTSLALGKTFKALLTVVLPYLTAFLKVLETVFNYISTMITSLLSLFGITVDFTSNAASGIEAVGGDIDTSGLDGVSEGMDNAAESADNAAESAEKMKGSLAG